MSTWWLLSLLSMCLAASFSICGALVGPELGSVTQAQEEALGEHLLNARNDSSSVGH